MKSTGITPLGFVLMLALIIGCFVFMPACTSIPAAPTDRQQFIAGAVEDTLSVGLVPILTKNRDYIPAAQGIADALGAFSGTTITPDGVAAFLAKTKLSADDQRTVASLVTVAWGIYARRYAEQVGAAVRPDVKLFLSAVSRGITNAIASIPR